MHNGIIFLTRNRFISGTYIIAFQRIYSNLLFEIIHKLNFEIIFDQKQQLMGVIWHIDQNLDRNFQILMEQRLCNLLNPIRQQHNILCILSVTENQLLLLSQYLIQLVGKGVFRFIFLAEQFLH